MIHKDWEKFIQTYQATDKLERLLEVLRETPFVPSFDNIFKAFELGFNDINVVILGQDPYYSPKGMATGRAFENGIKSRIPPSLRNIYKELNDEGYQDCDISKWPEQGVMLLNTALTTEFGKAGAHFKYWEDFIQHTINTISIKCDAPIFLLWGSKAQQYKIYMHKNTILNSVDNVILDGSISYVFESPHPSPFSADRGFFGNKHFENCNRLLGRLGKNHIKW